MFFTLLAWLFGAVFVAAYLKCLDSVMRCYGWRIFFVGAVGPDARIDYLCHGGRERDANILTIGFCCLVYVLAYWISGF